MLEIQTYPSSPLAAAAATAESGLWVAPARCWRVARWGASSAAGAGSAAGTLAWRAVIEGPATAGATQRARHPTWAGSLCFGVWRSAQRGGAACAAERTPRSAARAAMASRVVTARPMLTTATLQRPKQSRGTTTTTVLCARGSADKSVPRSGSQTVQKMPQPQEKQQ
jgi:hypothetical protein